VVAEKLSDALARSRSSRIADVGDYRYVCSVKTMGSTDGEVHCLDPNGRYSMVALNQARHRR